MTDFLLLTFSTFKYASAPFHSVHLANQLTNALPGISYSQFLFSSKNNLWFLWSKWEFYQFFWFLPKIFFYTPNERASVARFCRTDAPDRAQSRLDASFEVLCSHISGLLHRSIQLAFQWNLLFSSSQFLWNKYWLQGKTGRLASFVTYLTTRIILYSNLGWRLKSVQLK